MPCAGRKNGCRTSGRDGVREARKGLRQGEVRAQPQCEGAEQQTAGREGRVQGDWRKDAKESLGRRLSRIWCSLPALHAPHAIQHRDPPLLLSNAAGWGGPDKPPKPEFGELCLWNQTWALGKKLLYFKRKWQRENSNHRVTP